MRRCRSAPLVIAPRFYQPLPPLSPVGRQTSPFGICRMPDVSPVQIIPACDRTGPRASCLRLAIMTQEGKLLRALNPVKDPLPILVIAYSVRRLPCVVRSAAAGFQQTSVTLEEAAQNLGCLPLRTLMKITVPLIMANLLAGALLAFSFAMLEVSGSLILAQRQQDYPITKAIYELYQVAG